MAPREDATEDDSGDRERERGPRKSVPARVVESPEEPAEHECCDDREDRTGNKPDPDREDEKEPAPAQ